MDGGDEEWALEPDAMQLVLDLVEGVGAGAQVVECGSGDSTIAIAGLLRRLGGGRLHSLEHHGGWAQLMRERIAKEGLGGFAELIEAPLGEHPLAPAGCAWYAPEALACVPERIDLLLVDGPPAYMAGAERQRYPALPALAERLAPGAPVILDDAGRAGERWILARWRAETGLDFGLHPGGIAVAVS
jgi:hypothetical protein